MSSVARPWRTAFLTLRDETLASPSGPNILHLLNQLIFCQSDSLIAAARDLPPHEVASDLILLIELARNVSQSEGIQDINQSFTRLAHLIHGISHCSSLEMNSTSWALMLDSFGRIVQNFLGKAKTEGVLVGNVAVIKATKQCLESLRLLFRCLFGLHQAAASLSENEQLLNFILQVVGCLQGESIYSYYLSDKQTLSEGLWEVLIVAFGMIGEVYSRVGSCLPFDIWQSTIEVLRKVMDIWASRSLLEENIISRFYIELLHCLHLVLAEPRGYLEDHFNYF